MEDNKKVTSCIMLAANLSTPISLDAIFDPSDLKDTGIEYDSHITLLYARDKFLEKEDILKRANSVIREDMPDFEYASLSDYLNYQKKFDDFVIPVYDIFDLSSFENDSGYVILKLKDNNIWYEITSKINKRLGKEYSVTSDFNTYTPHLTLAEVEPGMTKKYLENEKLKLVLRDSVVHFEDLIISYDEGDKDYKKFNITSFCAVDRFFRERELVKEGSQSF